MSNVGVIGLINLFFGYCHRSLLLEPAQGPAGIENRSGSRFPSRNGETAGDAQPQPDQAPYGIDQANPV